MFMPEQHTGENIAEAIQATLEAWGLQETHQVCLTTDSGSNVIKAAERLQMSRWTQSSLGSNKCFER